MQYSETISELKSIKEAKGLTNRDISEGSGVPLGTVNRVFSGGGADFRYETTLKPIIRYLGELDDPLPSNVRMLQVDDPAIIALYKTIIAEKDRRLEAYMRREDRFTKIITILAVIIGILFIGLLFIIIMDLTHPDRGWWQIFSHGAASVFSRIRTLL